MRYQKLGLATLGAALIVGLTACSDEETSSNKKKNNGTGASGANGTAGGTATGGGAVGGGTGQGGSGNGSITFGDPSLEACVRTAAGLGDGDIFPADVQHVQHLECQNRAIGNIYGIEALTGLTELSLFENNIADLTPLSGLTYLTDLQLGRNLISDVNPLTTLTNVTKLGLSMNLIADVGPLGSLTGLQWLNLDINQISDPTALGGLSNLTWLTIEHNPVGDHATLAALANAGCDVYSEYNDGVLAQMHGTFGPAPKRFIIESARGSDIADPGKLVPQVTPEGELVFSYDFAGETHPVVTEYEGSISLDDDVFYYRRSQQRPAIAIGQLTGQGIELCKGQYTQTCKLVVGRKGIGGSIAERAPNMDDQPVFTATLIINPIARGTALTNPKRKPLNGAEWAQADTDLFQYTFSSPNQYDAGSCLYMATTGVMEILLNQRVQNPADIQYQGDTDLSERYLMNTSEYVPYGVIRWNLTDVGFTFNYHGGSLLDRDYPFAAGYVKDTGSGTVLSTANDPNAYVSCQYSWFDNDLPGNWQSMLTATPPFGRTSIFVDPKRDQYSYWRVALMDHSTVEKIKHELRTKNAPVVVVYNHYMYWHADIIVGYDDNAEHPSGDCPMVNSSLNYYDEKGATSYISAINQHMTDLGGCVDKGIFYVRDSIYDDYDYDYQVEEPQYQYGGTYPMTYNYSEKIVEMTYNWILYLSNHAYTVHRR